MRPADDPITKFSLALLTVLVVTAGMLSGCSNGMTNTAEAKFPPLGELVSVRGTKIHVVRKGAGMPVVMIHGASSNLREWTMTIFDQVAEKHMAIAIDRPGQGWSERPAGNAHDPRIQAEYIHGALKAIGVDRAVLVGHSWAGSVVLAQALDQPDSVSGILFLAGVSHPWPGGVSALRNIAATPVVGSMLAHVVVPLAASPSQKENGARAAFLPNAMPDNYVEDAGVDLVIRPGSFIADARDVAFLKPILAEMSARYSEIGVPVIALTGDADDVILTYLHTPPLIKKVQNGEIQVLPGVGHMPHHIAPDAVLKAIDDLVEQAN